MGKFVEFKKFGAAHKVGVIADHVLQYEETLKETRTNMQVKCVKLTTIDRNVYVDEPIEEVAKKLNGSDETVQNIEPPLINEKAIAEDVYRKLKQDFARQQDPTLWGAKF